MKFIVFVLGLVIGGGTGLWYGVTHPKEAADLNAKREEWVRQGKEEALNAIKTQLDQKLSQASTTPPAGAKSFGGTIGGGGSTKSEAETLKDMKSVVDQQLIQVQAKK